MKMSQTGGNSTFPRGVKGRLMILFLAISLTTLSGATTARAQVGCLGQCEEQLAGCLGQPSRDPIMETACQANYWSCVDGCLGSYAAILE